MESSSYDYETLRSALASSLASLEPLRINRDRIDLSSGPKFYGGYGEVFRGNLKGKNLEETGTSPVAIKQLRMTEDENVRIAVRLVREMQVWADLNHPNIVPFMGFYLGENTAWLISEWAANGNIQSYLSGNEVDHATRRKLVVDVARGLAYLHGLDPPICHADIKPGNILISDDIRGMIGDFGLSKILQADPTGLTTSKTIKGSMRYMSPELLDEKASHTLASDVWAFGCATLEIVTGIAPFNEFNNERQVVLQLAQNNPPASTLNSPLDQLEVELRTLLDHCWKMYPRHRPYMKHCLSLIEPKLPSDGFESTKGQGWTALFHKDTFSEFALDCVENNVAKCDIQFFPDGERYILSRSSPPHIFNVHTSKVDSRISSTPFRCLSLSQNGRYLATLDDKNIRVWDIPESTLIFQRKRPLGYARLSQVFEDMFHVSGNGMYLALLSDERNSVCIFMVDTGFRREAHLTRHAGAMNMGFSFSPDGQYFSVYSDSTGASIYNTVRYELVEHLKGQADPVIMMAWCEKGPWAISGGGFWARLWDVGASDGVCFQEDTSSASSESSVTSDGSQYGDIPCLMSYWHPTQINYVTVSQDDSILATICGFNRVVFWDLRLGTSPLTIQMSQSHYLHSVHIMASPDEEKRSDITLRFGSCIWRSKRDGNKRLTRRLPAHSHSDSAIRSPWSFFDVLGRALG